MDREEILAHAKEGDSAAYGQLCAAAADELYAAAALVLDRSDAEDAVRKAFGDAEGSIARIKTFAHFKAWLARTLSRAMIAKLKEYKASGFVPEGEGAEAASHSLPDIERLVFTLTATGGYKAHEIAVILGIPEDSVPARLSSAEARLGDSAISVRAFAAACKAPESLKASAKPSAPAEAVQPEAPAAPEPTDPAQTAEILAPDYSYPAGDTRTMEIISPKIWRSDEAAEAEAEPQPEPKLDAATFIAVVAQEHIKGGEFLRLIGNSRISNSAYREIEQNPELTKARLIELLEDSQLDENDYYKLFSAVKQRRELINAKEESLSRLEQAGLFDSYRPKSEHLMPKEEKSELALALEREAAELRKVEEQKLLEEERRREEERQRRIEEQRRLEEQQRRAEEQRRLEEERRREEERQRRIEEQRRLEEQQRRAEEQRRLEEEQRRAEEQKRLEEEKQDELGSDEDFFAAGAEPDDLSPEPDANDEIIGTAEIPFTPTIFDTYNLDKIRDDEYSPADEDEPDDKPAAEPPAEIPTKPPAAPVVEKAPEKRPVRRPATRRGKAAEASDSDDIYDDSPKKRSKAGKIAAIAIGAAAVLAAGGFGVKYALDNNIFGSAIPAETQEDEPQALASADDVFGALTSRTGRKAFFDPIYMRSDGTPCSEMLSKSMLRANLAGDVMLIRDRSGITAVQLRANDPPVIKTQTEGVPADGFIGFTADSECIYILYKSDDAVCVQVYDGGMKYLHTYTQSGSYRAFGAENGRFALVTAYAPASPDAGKPESFLPRLTLDGSETLIEAENIELLGGSAYSGYSVIGGLTDGEKISASAALGCYDCFAWTEGGTFTVLAADKNRTFALEYDITGGDCRLSDKRTFDGEPFSADCLNGDMFIGFDTLDGALAVRNGDKTVYCGIENELPAGISFTSDNRAYVVTDANGTSKLYGFSLTGGEILPDNGISAERVYMERLAACGDRLLGIRGETDSDGSVADLRLSLYSYDGKLNEDSAIAVTVDDMTPAQYAKYLSCAAEGDISQFAVNADGTRAAAAIRYFDGISDITRVMLFGTEGGMLTERGDLLLFDTNSEYCCLAISGDVLFIVTENRIITADTDSCKPLGYFSE